MYLRQRASVRHLVPGTILLIAALLVGRIEFLGDGSDAATPPGPVASGLAFSGMWIFGSAGYLLLPLLITRFPIRDKRPWGRLAYRFYSRHWFPFGAFLFFGRAVLLGAMEAALCMLILNGIVQQRVDTFQATAVALPVPFAVAHTAVEWRRLKEQGPRKGEV